MPKYIHEGVDTGKADGARDTGEAYGVNSVAMRTLGSPSYLKVGVQNTCVSFTSISTVRYVFCFVDLSFNKFQT